MRCPKCGYYSFDYLSECKKCGADLIRVRQELGLSGIKPSAMFLLGALTKESREKKEQGVAAEGGLGGVAEFDLGAEDAELEPGEASKTGASVGSEIVGLDRGDDLPADFTIDLSADEEADWSFLDAEEQKQQPRGIEAARTDSLADGNQQSVRTEMDAPQEGELMIELSEEDLEGLFSEFEETLETEDETIAKRAGKSGNETER